MGYEYRTIATASGAQGVAVVAPGVQFDAWDFFKGKAGREYSFAALHGYDIECVRVNTGGYIREYAVCYPAGVRAGASAGAGIPLVELMSRKGMPLYDADAPGAHGKLLPAVRAGRAEDDADLLGIYRLMDGRTELPPSFDWRNLAGQAYIGAVRDQGPCGSCYAFGAAAAAEGTYNWAMGRYGADCIDFSESFIMWCLGSLPEYAIHFGGCDGADYDYAELTALTVEGICLESVFPYTMSDPGCAYRGSPREVFTSWHRLPCGDVEAIKTAIMTYGVVDAAVYVSNEFQDYAGGVYEDGATDCYADPCYYTPVNHAIALVGWDDNPPEGGGGCWILRNSWGAGWGENGYMRIRYTAARVACEACYLVYTPPVMRTLTVASAHGGAQPSVGSNVYTNETILACTVTNSPVSAGSNRYVCIGWTGAGSVPAAGFGTNTGPFAITADSSITWLWATNVLAAPGAVAAGAGASVDGVEISWQAAPEAAGYRIWRGITRNPGVAAMLLPGTSALRYTDTNALVGKLYYYWLQSTNDGAVSAFSAYAAGWRGGLSSGVSADYDGDGLADPALYGEASGAWRILPSAYGYNKQIYDFNNLGGRGWASMTADFDGDGRADPAVYQELTGTWCALFSSSNYNYLAALAFPFGGAGWSGVAADFDGDGRADPGIYGRASGDWQVCLSTLNYAPLARPAFLGGPGAWPVVGDFDGDGFADPGVYHPVSGIWNFRLSGINYGAYAAPWTLGGPDHFPTPADYDGDGLADPVVRPASGNVWQARLSGQAYKLTSIPLDF